MLGLFAHFSSSRPGVCFKIQVVFAMWHGIQPWSPDLVVDLEIVLKFREDVGLKASLSSFTDHFSLGPAEWFLRIAF